MKIKILVTGVPGVGKTTIASELAKQLNYKCINEKELLTKEMYDEIRLHGSFVKDVDIEKLQSVFDKINDDVVFDGILFPELKTKFDAIIVLYLDEDRLRARLKEREYADVKIEDNIFAQQNHYLANLVEKKSENVLILGCESLDTDIKQILTWLKSHLSLD